MFAQIKKKFEICIIMFETIQHTFSKSYVTNPLRSIRRRPFGV
jgi:hypothetical protein